MRALFIIGMAALVSTCSPEPSQLERVQAEGVLRIATRNSPITHYLGAAGPEGPDHDLALNFARHLGVRLEVLELDRFGDLLDTVASGRADIAAAGLTVTAERAAKVDFGPAYQQVDQHVIYRRGRARPREIADLAGKRIEVVAHSSYVTALQAARGQLASLAWVENPTADAGELLGRVAGGDIDLTIVDSNIFNIFRRFYPELDIAFNIREGDRLAWAFRREGDRSLIEAATGWLAAQREAGDLEHIMDRYYGHHQRFDYVGTRRFIRDYQRMLPRYQPLFEQAASQADMDWRLIAAIGYQESRWDPHAESHMGATGIMMLTSGTARMMSVSNPTDPTQSIMGGTRYLWRLHQRVRKLAPEASRRDVTWMALAAYNMGYGHLLDARRLTAMHGGNPDRWSDLKKNLPLLMERQWYSQMRWGYAHSRETLDYVRAVRNYYDILRWLTDEPAGIGAENRTPITAGDPPPASALPGPG